MARGAGSSRLPIAEGQIPAENKVFREFKGINTQAKRQAIDNDEFAWLENVMPIGFGNLKAVPQISAVRATIAGGRTIYYRKGYNIAGVNYLFVACTDGSAWQVLTDSPYTVTQIAAAGTFSGSGTQISQWKNERILIINSAANGYRDWNGVTLTILSGTTGAPAGGTCIATYAGKVWIVLTTANGRTLAWSDSQSYTSFVADGGSTTITDETLTSSIKQLLVANNFLYFFGVDSINVIADVQVVGGVTLFSNTNLVANSGTDLPQTPLAYYRSIWYFDTAGAFALYGATPRPASPALDGIVSLIDFTQPVTGATVTLYNQLCVVYCFTYNDPVQSARQLLALYFNKKWFVGSQSTDVDGIAAIHGSTDALWGTKGSDVYQLFSDTSADVSQTIQSKLWDFDDFISIKQALRFGAELTLGSGQGSIDVTVDTERYQIAPSGNFAGSNAFVWYGAASGLYFSLPGTSGSYLSTPDSVAASILGDIQIDVYAAADDWTAPEVLVSKYTFAGSQNSYAFYMSGGLLTLETTPNGNLGSVVQAVSTVTIPGTNGSPLYLRTTRDVDNGAAGNTTKFYTSTDGLTYTQLGASVVNAGTTSIFDSTSTVQVGAFNAGTGFNFTGKIYSVDLYNGIGGTLAVSCESSDAALAATTFISSATGETYTVNGAAEVLGTFNPLTVFPWFNSLGAPFTWLAAGYVWFQGDAEVQGHYLGFTIESESAGNIYEGMQMQYRRLPAGWGT